MTLRFHIGEDFDRLCKILNTTYGGIGDLMMFLLFKEYRVDPVLVEKMMVKRKQFNHSMSISDNVRRVYGKEAVDLIEKLI